MNDTNSKLDFLYATSVSSRLIFTTYLVLTVTGGGDCRNFEPIGRLSFSNLDKSIQKLRRIYREEPEWFEIPNFAQKIY